MMGGYEQRGKQATAASTTYSIATKANTDVNNINGAYAAGANIKTVTDATLAATISGGMIGATYDLGAVKLSGSIENGNTTGKSDFGYAIGVAVPMGAAVIQVGWAAETQSADKNVDGTSDGLGATVVYTLSKRTNVYGSFIRSNYTPVATLSSDQIKSTATAFGVGVRHDF